MFRRPSARVVAALALVGAATAGTLVQTAGAGAATPTVLHLTASVPRTSALFHPCGPCFEQTKPKGAHIGGEEIDAGVLRNASGKRVGHYALVSVGVTPFNNGPGELQQTATLVLSGGQLVVEGVEEPPLNGGTSAILGGTGRYVGARGQLHYTDRADGTTALTIDLLH